MFGCTVYDDGHMAAIDTWNPSKSKTNVLDDDQVSLLNGGGLNICLSFSSFADWSVPTHSGE